MQKNYAHIIKKLSVRTGVIGAAVATSSCLSLTGFASADTISGPNSYNSISTRYSNSDTLSNSNNINASSSNNQTARTGSATSSDNTIGGYGGYGSNSGSSQNGNWASYDPATYDSNGSSFMDWYNAALAQLDQYNANNWSMSSGTQINPVSGTMTWSSYDPAIWQADGQSYANWYGQTLGYMTSNYGNLQQNWTSGDDSGVSTGDANNNNSSGSNVSVDNAGGSGFDTTSYNSGVGSGGYGGDTIITGPGSTNEYSTNYSNSDLDENNNTIGVNNNNSQSANTGNASDSGNTIGGSASTGNASNSNGGNTDVYVSNGSGSGNGNQGFESASQGSDPFSDGTVITGPGSRNYDNMSYSNTYYRVNNNNVRDTSTSSQGATSSNANSSGNTVGGGAYSGSAYNDNNSGGEVGVTN